MTTKYVRYKNIGLAKGSVARDLFDRAEFTLLDKHLKQLDQNERDLLKKYDVSSKDRTASS